jgi:type IV fimbrial biogenesis protein FimT
MNAHASQRGMSLIELMFAITVLAILLGIGAPSFANLIRDNRVTSLTNDFVGGVALARSEATRRGLPVSLCPTTDGESCEGDSDWSTGWLLFTDDVGTQGEVDVPGDEVLQVNMNAGGGYAPQGYSLTGAMEYLTFAPNGLTQADVPAVAGGAIPAEFGGGTDPAGWAMTVQQDGCTGGRARQAIVTALGRVTTRKTSC